MPNPVPDSPGPVASPVAEVRGLSVAYHADAVLRGVDLAVPAGVVMGVVGPNGAGKSTLLKAMLGLLPALTGSVRFFGQRLGAVRDRVGYMPQAAGVDWDFPATAADVVAMGTYDGWRPRLGRRRREERDRALVALEEVGMADFADRQIGQLSGGQRQRVFLARTLVRRPDLYLMDEPFAGIDARSQESIVRVLHELRAAGRTVVLVHHDLPTVRAYCDHVTLLNRRVVASGPLAEAFTTASIATAYDVPVGEMGALGGGLLGGTP
ncbi:metal ABC transporter ATP-binding protein [Serinibacter salmoneus]|uniref:metal ABC transporter ATP-binding protein n=1 Tax=Serinibacter salmoneus TaxID=556530 RepID=UPI001FE7B56B|nr:ABC transporter ATP-binding protein [Serinibacter salmoneus]